MDDLCLRVIRAKRCHSLFTPKFWHVQDEEIDRSADLLQQGVDRRLGNRFIYFAGRTAAGDRTDSLPIYFNW